MKTYQILVLVFVVIPPSKRLGFKAPEDFEGAAVFGLANLDILVFLPCLMAFI
jgi:hypothetical protein